MKLGASSTARKVFMQYRKAAGLTQEDVADMIGVDRNTIIAYEKGRGTPRKAMLEKIDELVQKWRKEDLGDIVEAEMLDSDDYEPAEASFISFFVTQLQGLLDRLHDTAIDETEKIKDLTITIKRLYQSLVAVADGLKPVE